MKVYSEDNVAVRKVSIQRLKKYSVSAGKAANTLEENPAQHIHSQIKWEVLCT